ncbi:MAG: pyridoxamine 5'-phosphate oxidase family protein [Deltaproteobacteria bacterium]|jgi:nitroimidazol reductase NimA-like FMN-containing flavoprotein (pyridoxamine 5'-phosphate oxidase superfamily)
MAHEMRRSDREISSEEALRILQKAEYGVMSTVSGDRFPYGVPLNFCVIDDHIYFHSAVEGRIIDNITDNPKVSFCVVGETCLLPAQFGTKYESAIVFGTAGEVFEQEKQMALEGLLLKYSRNHYSAGLEYIQSNFEKTRVFKISIETVTGKSRK